MDEREAAYWELHDAVPRGWHLTPAAYYGEEALWHVTVIDLRRRGRGLKHDAITGTGATELEAVRALATMLRAPVPKR